MNKTFEDCVKRFYLKDGSLRIECKLGLWAVEGKDFVSIEKESKWYWTLYAQDGEYDSWPKSFGNSNNNTACGRAGLTMKF